MNNGQMMGQANAELTPENALVFLTNATGDLQVTRRDHAMIQRALFVLNTTINQWRAMQDPHPPVEQPSDGPPDAPGGPEDPDKLLTEDDG